MRRLLILVLAALAIAACGTEENGSADVECGGEEHPCLISEVPEAEFERTLELGNQASAILSDGGSNADAAEMLESQEDVVEVSFDEEALRFRVDGAREHWIMGEAVFDTLSAPLATKSTPNTHIRRSRVTRHVAGQERISKSALVLAPFSYELTVDETQDVESILSATRGYEGGVKRMFANSHLDPVIGVDAYKSLNLYDVVHIATHGATICDPKGCRGVIIPFSLEGHLLNMDGNLQDKLRQIEAEGMATWQDTNGQVGVELTADFFTKHYGEAGLQNTLIFLTACEIFTPGGSDLVNAMRGDTSVFFGWDAVTNAVGAQPRTIELYTHLSEGGYPAEAAYSRMSSIADGHGSNLRLRSIDGDEDLRIRDVVEILDPATGDPLGEGVSVGIVGEAGDGESDAAPYLIQIDGIPSADSADETQVEITIDGETVGPFPVSDGQHVGDGRWTLSGEIELPYDLEEDTEVLIEASALLHDGGASADESSAILSGDATGGDWELTIQYARIPVDTDGRGQPDTATATLQLTPAEFQPFDDEIRYEVTSGTVTYDPSKQDRFCIVTGDAVTFAVTPDIAAGSLVRFDLSTDPTQFEAFITVGGPKYEADYSCRAGTGDDAPEGYQEPETHTETVLLVLLNLTEGDVGTLSAEGNSASGTVVDDQTGVMPGAIVNMSYTLTRTD